MGFKPSDNYVKRFTTSDPSTGAAADADSLPVATAAFAGTGTGTMSLTVTHISTGLYEITGTVPAGRVRGDVLNVSVAATCGGVAGVAVVDTRVIEAVAVAANVTQFGGHNVVLDANFYPGVNIVDVNGGAASTPSRIDANVVSVNGTTFGGALVPIDKTGHSLAAAGLDAVTVTEPTGPVSAMNFRQLLRWLVMRFNNASRTPTTLVVKTNAGSTATTQAVSDDGSGTESTGVTS